MITNFLVQRYYVNKKTVIKELNNSNISYGTIIFFKLKNEKDFYQNYCIKLNIFS